MRENTYSLNIIYLIALLVTTSYSYRFSLSSSLYKRLLVPVGAESERKGKCACGKINDLERAKKGEFPWLVSLVLRNDIENEPLCWGSLINSRYILSSAHCTSKYEPFQVEVVLSSSAPQQNPRRNVASIRNHPLFSPRNLAYDNDVSLIRLREPLDLELGDVSPICLPPQAPMFYEGEKLKESYFNRTAECDFPMDPYNKTATLSRFMGFHTVESKRMLKMDKVNIQIMDNSTTCAALYPNRMKSQYLCGEILGDSGGSRNHSKCNGTSGAPLTYMRRMKSNCDPDYKHPITLHTNGNLTQNQSQSDKDSMKVRFLQVGISSTQAECQVRGQHPVLLFTRISRYISWIRANSEEGTYCSNSPHYLATVSA